MNILLTASPEANHLLNWILSALLLAGFYLVIKKLTTKPSTQGEPSTPLHVKMEDHFVTRHEFDKLHQSQVRDIEKLEAIMLRIFDKMDERDAALTEKIEKVAKGAFAGRIRIHTDLKEMNERVIKVETLTHNQYGKEKDKK